MIVCVCVCQCVPMPHGSAVDLQRSPFILQMYRLLFTQSSLIFLVIKTLYIKYFPSHFRQTQGLMAPLDCVCECVFMGCEHAGKTEISGVRVCMCE